MVKFFVGTLLCITAGLIVLGVVLLNLPRDGVIIAIPVLFIGAAFQFLAFWENRPSKRIPWQ